MRTTFACLGATLALALASSACSSGTSLAPASRSAEAPTATMSTETATASGTTVTIGEFNCDISDEYPKIPPAEVASAIQKSGADVVGIEEGGGEMPVLAKDLGWSYYDPATQIVSRLPLISPPGGSNLYDLVQAAPGKVFALVNVHLPSSSYGPGLVAKGASAREVITRERQIRVPPIQHDLAAISKVRKAGIPVFFVGDFNSPSALDWTKAAIGSQKHRPYALAWPASETMLQAGFKDSYRVLYPDPIADPGLTWPAIRNPGGTIGKRPTDRIDYVYYSGQANPTAFRIIGEPGGPQVSASVSPWPSDHRMIAADFSLTGATPPTFVSVPQRLITAGTRLAATYHAPGDAASLEVRRVSGVAKKLASVSTARLTSGSDGTISIPTSGLRPGAYDLSLVSTSGGVLAHTPFWLERPGQKPVVTTSKATYSVGEPVSVSWEFAPGDRWDWIGIYHRGANPNVAYYIDWLYTGARVAGSLKMGAGAHGKWPLPAGKYSVYLLKDDLYVKIAGANFTIR